MSLPGHQCATESRVTLWQSANPCCVFVGVVTSCVLCARVRGLVSRSCATENTYTPARLEALFKLSVVTILRHSYRSLQHFCGLWVLSFQLVILFDTFFISFEIASKFYCLLSAVSQFILFKQMQICFFPGRLINFECCRVCPWTLLQSSRLRVSRRRLCCEHLRL